jgi:integrase
MTTKEPFTNPTGYIHADGLNGSDKLVMAGLPMTVQETNKPAIILEYAWQLKKNGKSDATIETASKRLRQLSEQCDITDPEQVKATLASLGLQNSTKQTIARIYNGFLNYIGEKWERPRYTVESKIPFIPTEQEIDSLISASRNKTATLLQLLKETGMRIGEARRLQWSNIDQERKVVYVTAEKGSNSRILPISTKLSAMLNNLPKTNEKVFPQSEHTIRVVFTQLRNRTAEKLNNPRLKQIHLHTFRHWKGTTEYHKTKDIIHVKTILGHKSIENTMIYINIESALYLADADQYTAKVAHNETEMIQLIEAGFEYVTDITPTSKLFRKRK